MKAKFPGSCYYCTPCHGAIKVGDDVIPHPAVHKAWVHKWHLASKKEKPVEVQVRLFG